jgi:lipopolysaccharide/colanic/teichoic acid biosynthesis glycosyltransferase
MNAFFKRCFDLIVSLLALVVFLPFILFFWFCMLIDTGSHGFFFQKRVGQYGKLFTIYKLQTIQPTTNKISRLGYFVRKYKIDELPQLVNVLKGDMSIVGPRPDIQGYYDRLEGENRKILELRPGITCEASIKYKNETELLEQQENPLNYNDTVIFPDKIRMNLAYYYKRSFSLDLKIIMATFFNIYKV